MGRELMRKLLQAHLDLRQPGQAIEPVRDAAGTALTPTPVHGRSLESIFGICSMIGGSSKAERKRVCWRPNRNAETFLIIFVRFLWTNRSGCFKLNWMSGKQTGINAVDQILQKVDLAGIQDERARECIRLLLNLIESLTADLRKAHAEI